MNVLLEIQMLIIFYVIKMFFLFAPKIDKNGKNKHRYIWVLGNQVTTYTFSTYFTHILQNNISIKNRYLY